MSLKILLLMAGAGFIGSVIGFVICCLLVFASKQSRYEEREERDGG